MPPCLTQQDFVSLLTHVGVVLEVVPRRNSGSLGGGVLGEDGGRRQVHC